MKKFLLSTVAAFAVLAPTPAEAFFTNCREIRGSGSFRSKTMVCNGDFGDRVVVECDSLGSNCIKLCTIGGIMDGCD